MYLTPLGARSVRAESEAHVTAGWWVPLVAGVLTIVAGLVVMRINWTVTGLAVFLGVIFIARGISDALGPKFDDAPRSLSIVAGLLEAGVGVALIAWPGPGLVVIATFFGCWLVIGGMLEIAGAIINRDEPIWWLVLLLGIVQVILGVWALDKPAVTLAVLIVLAGIWAVIVGTLEIVLAFELRRVHQEALAKERTLDDRARPRQPSELVGQQ